MAPQTLPQEPQLVLSVLVLTQLPLQSVGCAVVHEQVPFAQVRGDAQALPQVPQLLLSLSTLTSHPSTMLLLQSPKLGRQVSVQAPLAHPRVALVAPGHTCPQVPQLSVVVTFVSQPSTALPLQSV